MQHQPPTYTVFCLASGENSPFPVNIQPTAMVDELKDVIAREKPHFLNNCDADGLTLFKVDAHALDVSKARAQIAALHLSPMEMNPLFALSEYYPATPPKETIHILVKLPSYASQRRSVVDELYETISHYGLAPARYFRGWFPGGDNEQMPGHSAKTTRQYSPQVAHVDSSTARRESTVNALYERLNRYHFVLVRGTPASGKSTLAQLLYNHILTEEPEADPILVGGWRRDLRNWVARLTATYDRNGSNIIIIDEAQLTYWDDGFWNSFLKNLTSDSPDRVILFASYGDPTDSVSVEGTSIVVPYRNQVSLRPVDHGDGIAAAGLFLTREEFNDMVKQLCPAGRFKADFLDYVLRVTAGHTGAVGDLLRIVLAHDSYRDLKHDEEYSLEIFHSQFPIRELWSRLNSCSIFKRGVPTIYHLEEEHFARVFRQALINKRVRERMLDTEEEKKALLQCFKRGWLHATKDKDGISYIFTTVLHKWFVEYALGTTVSDPSLIKDQNILDFVTNVIRHFSHDRLTAPRILGPSNERRTPEARYEDEFYRCCFEYSQGSFTAFLEHEDGTGQVDFWIPAKNWGVELLREGDGLQNHSTRFIGPGSYAQMDFDDYIILDFCKIRPREKHPNIPNLYHVLMKGDREVEILSGSSLEMVAEFSFLN